MKLHEGEEFSKNIMAASFYHEFSANKARAQQARYHKINSSEENARALARKLDRYPGVKRAMSSRAQSHHFNRLYKSLQAANLIKTEPKAIFSSGGKVISHDQESVAT